MPEPSKYPVCRIFGSSSGNDPNTISPFARSLRFSYTEAVAAPTSDRIVKTPDTCGGKARIAGHRIRVLDIVAWHEHQGMSPDEIVSQFPSLTLADIHTALAYYFDHIEEIRAEMQDEQRMVEESRRNNPSLLDAKLKRSRMDEAS